MDRQNLWIQPSTQSPSLKWVFDKFGQKLRYGTDIKELVLSNFDFFCQIFCFRCLQKLPFAHDSPNLLQTLKCWNFSSLSCLSQMLNMKQTSYGKVSNLAVLYKHSFKFLVVGQLLTSRSFQIKKTKKTLKLFDRVLYFEPK